jgi:hypothetical protein
MRRPRRPDLRFAICPLGFPVPLPTDRRLAGTFGLAETSRITGMSVTDLIGLHKLILWGLAEFERTGVMPTWPL